jgi:hypothetical protein
MDLWYKFMRLVSRLDPSDFLVVLVVAFVIGFFFLRSLNSKNKYG